MVTNYDRKSFGSRRKCSKLAQTIGTVDVLVLLLAFQEPLRRELPHVQIFMNYGPNHLT